MSRKFRDWQPDAPWLFPPSPRDWLPEGHLVYFLLEVTAQIKDLGRSRITLLQTVHRGDELLNEAEVHLVCVSLDSFKPVAVPEVLRVELQK